MEEFVHGIAAISFSRYLVTTLAAYSWKINKQYLLKVRRDCNPQDIMLGCNSFISVSEGVASWEHLHLSGMVCWISKPTCQLVMTNWDSWLWPKKGHLPSLQSVWPQTQFSVWQSSRLPYANWLITLTNPDNWKAHWKLNLPISSFLPYHLIWLVQGYKAIKQLYFGPSSRVGQ